MSMSKKPQPDEYPPRPTRYVAFQERAIKGGKTNMAIEEDNVLLTTRLMLMLKSLLAFHPIEIDIKKIIINWCPLVEPGTLTSISISVKYQIAEEEGMVSRDSSIVFAKGRISEDLSVTIHPTRPMMYSFRGRMTIPWSVHIETEDIHDASASDNILGIIKIWCPLTISRQSSKTRQKARIYQSPTIQWGNIHYPYYVPYVIMRHVRGLVPLEWEKTEQFKHFKEDVLYHTDNSVIPDHTRLSVMQTMSYNDITRIAEMTKDCLLNKGGEYCSCKNAVSDYMKECCANKDDQYNAHQSIFKQTELNIKSGRWKGSIEGAGPQF
ncbi:movement protein [Cardamom vein clearing nucleorhabdovirus 1]|uniref:Movement protein n=1 Tax=cardamom vein clearing virus TaxID=2849749 RepID=A0A6M6R365_9RHAB|nr:movement protein [Cardamom vein clearing nucleorhabdovirus 1]QJZ27981.1 movement protein [Cardamom vein clearing nucleorhabdovirus 1]